MVKDWEERDCSDCKFRVGDLCRRCPPYDGEYPEVFVKRQKKLLGTVSKYFLPACAEYKEMEE